jgi:hypothetical protein
VSFRSKSFKDGEEILSEDSYLFQFKPEYISRQENYWDQRQERFACAKGSSGLSYKKAAREEDNNKRKPLNEEIVKQIE